MRESRVHVFHCLQLNTKLEPKVKGVMTSAASSFNKINPWLGFLYSALGTETCGSQLQGPDLSSAASLDGGLCAGVRGQITRRQF